MYIIITLLILVRYLFCIFFIILGRHLKRIDRTLISEWSQWCDNVFTSSITLILWDFFSPQSCDVHCASYSQVRDSFMKLLRPGVDYRETFVEFAEKKIINKQIEAFKDEKDYFRQDREEKEELDQQIESLRKESMAKVALSKSEMSTLLLSMGIHMKESELNSLIDAFDSNGDGVVTLTEFIDFIGPKRDRKGGNMI